MRKKIRPSDEKLKLREPAELISSKLKDEAVRKKQIKFQSLCPMFAYYYACTNMILKDYCPYYHTEDVRKAFFVQTEFIEKGMKPD